MGVYRWVCRWTQAWSQFLTSDHRSENFKGLNSCIICFHVWQTHKKLLSVCVFVHVFVCVCVFFSLFNDLTQWARTELGHSFSWASGVRDDAIATTEWTNMTSNAHTHPRACACTNPRPLRPLRLSHSHSGSTQQGPSNVHLHMHKHACTHTHKRTHYATRLQTLLVCVWNERRVVRKTACLKKEPCPAWGTNTTQSRDAVATAFSLSYFLPSRFFSLSLRVS